jgi:hypothetical protein
MLMLIVVEQPNCPFSVLLDLLETKLRCHCLNSPPLTLGEVGVKRSLNHKAEKRLTLASPVLQLKASESILTDCMDIQFLVTLQDTYRTGCHICRLYIVLMLSHKCLLLFLFHPDEELSGYSR